MGLMDQPCQTDLRSLVVLVVAVYGFPFFKMGLQNHDEALAVFIVLGVKVDVKHRSRLPVIG